METNINAILESYHFNVLKDMAGLLKIDPGSNRKSDHIRLLEKVLFTPQAIDTALDLLGETDREALYAIQRAGGKIAAARLRTQLVRQRILQPPTSKQYRYEYRGPSIHAPQKYRTTFESVVGRLIALGLVWAQELGSGYVGRTKITYDCFVNAVIPPEVLARLPAPPMPVASTFSPDTLTRVQEGSARAFQRDLYLYWSAVRTESPRLTTQNRLYKKDLARLNAALQKPEEKLLDETDMPRLIFIRRLMTALGILRERDRQIEALDHPKFLSQNPTTRVERTLAAWRDSTFWNEVLSISGLGSSSIGTRLDNAPDQIVQARRTVLAHITELHRANPGWASFDGLTDSLRTNDYEFLLPRDFKPDYGYYYYTYTSRSPYSSYGNALRWDFHLGTSDEAEGWEYIEANLIRAVVLEPLFWMGLVDVGYDGSNAIAYRLTEMGAWVLGVGGEINIPEGEGKVIVQPNYEIVALDPISDMALARLDEFADRISAERAMQYTLSRESVYRAQKKGWTAQRIIDTLQQMSDHPLPQNVGRTLLEWQTLHERITIHRQATLLQAVDASLMDELAGVESINRHLATRPGPDVALIAQDRPDAAALIENLHEIGHLPARTGSARDVLRPSLTIAADGQIHFREALPSIFLFGLLAPFTETTGDHRCLLTETAVRRALTGTASANGGYTVDKILETLRTLHIGPLPRWIEIKIRAWGHYYGDAAIQPLLLIQIQDEKTLHELMQEPELEGLLQPFEPNAQKALAIVSPQQLESLRRALDERGIRINETLK